MADVFFYLCGQGRCFVLDGAVLPVCQRCLGLYAGAAVTAVWLLMTGGWRCGLPGRRAGLAQAAALSAAMLGGLHVIDAGPGWRLVCGLWTGHVVTLWLIGAAVQLAGPALPDRLRMRPWRRSQDLTMLATCPLLAVAAWPASSMTGGWHLWTVVALIGVGCLGGVVLFTIACLVLRVLIRAMACWTHPPSESGGNAAST